MQRIEDRLARLSAEDRVGLMTHMVYGFPSPEESRRVAETMLESGVDFLEVQLPFSDPTADGPTITAACQTALDNGARIQVFCRRRHILQRVLERKFWLIAVSWVRYSENRPRDFIGSEGGATLTAGFVCFQIDVLEGGK